MKEFFVSGWRNFKKSSLITKIFAFLGVGLYLFVLSISFIKVDYEVITPGSINYTASSVKVEANNEAGFIYTVGVYTHTRISVIQYWVAKTNDFFDLEVFDPEVDLNDKAQRKFGTISKEISINNAIINAYQEAAKIDPSIVLSKEYKGVIVSAITPYAKTGLDYSDIVIKVNDQTFTNINEFRNLVTNFYDSEPDKEIKFTIIRDELQKEVYASFISGNSGYIGLGVAFYDYYQLDPEKSTPKFSIVDPYSSIGSSGGGMLSLSIYNSLLPGDITKGKKIVGTGTIELDGSIGNIAGVKQKIITANNYNIDIFFINEINYDLAKEEYDRIGATFTLVKVNNFIDIIEFLENMEVKNDES
ncbi:MAG TPA: PDZ domain-containing protein [Bacilli bacterium]|nr:PDZ domain-containing protein [Bacilli bacterium]